MYKLKTIAQKGMMLAAVATLVTASLPPVQVFAYNELNPLTERSLLLSSSAPGFVDTDGSGNANEEGRTNPTGTAYAPAGSGANGKKSGQTFTFRVSTDSTSGTEDAGDDRPIKAFTFQYCTEAAGLCQAPGTNQGDARPEGQRKTDSEGDVLPERETNAVAHPLKRSDFDVVGTPGFDVIMINPAVGEKGHNEAYAAGAEINVSADWTLTARNAEDDAHTGALSGKRNLITLTNATGIAPVFDQKLKIVFKASDQSYITNPGYGKFFVKINTFDSIETSDHTTGVDNPRRIDGGVTVANMMTDSIHITTKVLETMQFSVGIALPENQERPADGYGVCDAINVTNNNRIDLGNTNAENSLEVDRAHEQKSYWRVQSNSSGGATIYYSGDTLRNTVGDHIEAIPSTGSKSIPGREQFGLALVSAGNDVHDNFLADAELADSSLQRPHLNPLEGYGTVYRTGVDTEVDGENYSYNSNGNGSARSEKVGDSWVKEDGTPADPQNQDDFATFAFNTNSQTVPEPIAQGTEVLSCTTGKMRYVGNIGADTPAGVYTTKINYLAAPQY